jgi:DNA (cytosine-5)-methyltransferase 1
MAFTFVDLFSGIGGFHLGCVQHNGRCVAACEIDPIARQIYETNYNIKPHDDIRTLKAIPGIDLVCAGFPCQSHSSLGKRKGFNDSRGELFYILVEFIKKSQPKFFLLENVMGLVTSNKGENFKIVIESLRETGYKVTWAILDSQNFGLPQHRKRVYIVGNKDTSFDISQLKAWRSPKTIVQDIMDEEVQEGLHCNIFKGHEIYDPPHETVTGFLLRAKLSDFTNRKLFSSNGIIGTMTTASPPPIYDERHKMARHLSKTELLRCQGFPTTFIFPKSFSRTKVVHYLGNSVSVNVIYAVVKELY